MSPHIFINENRFKQNFDKASSFGATENGGLNRPTFSEQHTQVRSWFKDLVKASDLVFRIDEAGNHSGILKADNASAKTFIIGSHLDSVPYGGRFDGNLGVMIALEVAETIRDHKIKLPFHLEVMDFTDEEGTHLPLWGSRALCGKLSEDEVFHKFQGTDTLDKVGLNAGNMKKAERTADSLAGYMEVHIEQGVRLEESETDVGIVNSITGIGRYYISFKGSANHAGTTPMDKRKDASLGAAAFILECNELVVNEFPGCVCNTGNVEFSPTAFNVIPQVCKVWLEYRAPDVDLMQEMERKFIESAKSIANRHGLEVGLKKVEMVRPVPMANDIQQAFARACSTLGYSHKTLTSGAGHDAQSFEGLCSSGMVFIPSVGGYSHSDREFTKWEDCIKGANTLLHAVLEMKANYS